MQRRRFARGAVLVLVMAALAAGACHQVGSGQLHVSNDESGIGRDNTFLHAVAPDPGDAWPAAGEVGVLVQGDDFGSPPSYGMNGYLYLVRTTSTCPQSEGTPETFKLSDVTIAGVITVTNGSVNQVVTMTDMPSNRAATWGLLALTEMPDTNGGHRLYRCGTVAWTP
jgi:hypothetical protein